MKRAWICMGLTWLLCAVAAQSHAQVQVQVQTQDLPLAQSAASAPELQARTDGDVPEAIARQRKILAEQRQAILSIDSQQKAACWQKFAVNACLSEVRRVRRQALEPIHQQELVLNAQERQWRTTQRDLRLQGKQSEGKENP